MKGLTGVIKLILVCVVIVSLLPIQTTIVKASNDVIDMYKPGEKFSVYRRLVNSDREAQRMLSTNGIFSDKKRLSNGQEVGVNTNLLMARWESIGLDENNVDKLGLSPKVLEWSNDRLIIGYMGVFNYMGTIAYGNPFGDLDNKGLGIQRYMGYTVGGDEFSNMYFPDDIESPLGFTGGMQGQNWIRCPWVSKNLDNTFDNIDNLNTPENSGAIGGEQNATFRDMNLVRDTYESDFLWGILYSPNLWKRAFGADGVKLFIDLKNASSKEEWVGIYNTVQIRLKNEVGTQYKGESWSKYFHVLQPPSNSLVGFARMWKISSIGETYSTYPLVYVTNFLDYWGEITELDNTDKHVNTPVTVKGLVQGMNNSWKNPPDGVKCRWTLKSLNTGNILDTRETDVINADNYSNYSFIMPNEDVKVIFEVNHLKNPEEKNVIWAPDDIDMYANNVDEVVIKVGDGSHSVNLNLTGDLELSQKRISKSFTHKADIAFNISGISDYHEHQSGTDPITGKPVYSNYYFTDSVDSYYKHIVKNTATLKQSILGFIGQFLPTYANNVRDGNVSYNGTSYTMNDVKMNYTIWRGQDKPTIASYKESSSHPLLALGLGYGKTPQTTRNTVGGYTDTFSIKLDKDNEGDYTTIFECSKSSCDSTRSQGHSSNYNNLDATVAVHTFIGSPNSGSTVSSLPASPFTIGGITFNKFNRFILNNTNWIKFYPYVQMAYETTGATGATAVNVLSQYESAIKNNDYVEVGWYNPQPSISLTIDSTLWSTHARAINAAGWGGMNKVLPGGSVYTLDTKTNQTKVGISTWQTYIPSDQLSNVTDGSTYYSLNNVRGRRVAFGDEVEQTLDTIDVVQYLDSNYNNPNAFNGVRLLGQGGQIVYGQKTTTDPKYWLKQATPQNGAGSDEADIDVINKTITERHYKIVSDTAGNVTILAGSDGVNWTPIQTLTRTETASNLSGEAKVLDDRTKAVTNYLLAIDRNKGNDPTASIREWYNEAFDGICVLRTDMVYTIGFNKPTKRSAAVDTKLCAPRASTSELFTKANISNFRLNEKSYLRNNKANGYIGSLNGVDIIIPEMHNMYVSKTFSIPNATVLDNRW